MAGDQSRESLFEREICEYLQAQGWLYSPNSAGYDAARAIFPEDTLGWLEDTQAEQVAKVVEQVAKVVKTGSPVEAKQREQLLDAITKKLDTPLSHGGAH
jgi:type I restriction enzyme R subunit